MRILPSKLNLLLVFMSSISELVKINITFSIYVLLSSSSTPDLSCLFLGHLCAEVIWKSFCFKAIWRKLMLFMPLKPFSPSKPEIS